MSERPVAPPRRGERMTADLRLAGVAGGTWLAALAALHLPAHSGALLALGAAVLAGVTGWLLRHRWRWILVGLLIGAACGAATTAARVTVRDAAPLAALVHDRATVHMRLTVSDDPRPVRGVAGRPSAYAIPASASAVAAPGRPEFTLSVDVLVLAADPAWRGLVPGTRLAASGRLAPGRPGDLDAAVLSVSGPPDDVGPAPWPQRAADALRAGLRRVCARLPAAPGGLLPGLVDGDTSRLDPGVADDFRATGMTHLVAVSGANLAIVVSVVLLVARWCRTGPYGAALLCGVALVGFVILARPSPSVLRAAVMGGLGLLALALGRPRAAVPALLGSVVALLLVDPALANDAGFTLSVFATGGLLLLAPAWRDALHRRRVPRPVAEALAIPAAASVACAPVIAGISGTVSLVAVPANLVAEPVVAPATVLGVVAALLSVVWPGAAEFVAWLASWPATWLVAVARVGAHAPGGVLAWPGGTGGALLLAVLLVVALWATRRPVIRLVIGVCAVAAAVGAVPVRLVASGWPPAGAVAVVCDVGQGDEIVLPIGAGRAVVVDAGPQPDPTDRCLSELAIRDVPLLVLSHFHIDHVGGIAGVFRGRRVERVLTSGLPEPAGGYRKALAAAAAAGTPVTVPSPGWTWSVGAVRLTVLGPVHPIVGTGSDANNNSLVVRAEVGGQRLLLAGDAMVEEQADLLATLGAAALRAEVLKVAHHGSAYQDAGFLTAVRPAVALVSVGVGNPYGHPSMPMLDMLRRMGATVLRTDVDGDLAALTNGSGLGVMRHGVPPGRHPP
jgi:competence protein ComEC